MKFPFLSLLLLAGSWSAASASPAGAPTEAEAARPWTRWWWPGSAVTTEGLTAQLESMAAAGLGGVEITPIYGARGAEEDYRDFLSPAWSGALAHTVTEAARLGLRVDLTTGTGWPFGGPNVTPADGSHQLVWSPETERLVGQPTNMQVKRAAPGGTGLVLDPFSPAALRRYLAHFSPALDALPRPGLRAQFHDSFEYYHATWTPELARAFAADHGYDLHAFGAALLSPDRPETPAALDQLARLKYDYRVTLGRLHLQYLDTWKTWAHDRGWQVRNQSHGAPANLLDLYGAVDIPETETFGSTPFPLPGLRREPRTVRGEDDLPEPLMMRMAASAAHVMGRPLVSSETATWLREHWHTSLAMVKPEIDRLFAHGINHLIYHGTVYSPPDVAWPGWLFYASTQFNPANPWWRDFPALNAYVTRVQHGLQSGEPDHDVLLYWPYADVIHDPDGLTKPLTVHHVDWLTTSPFGRTARDLLDGGITFDYVSDLQLHLLTVTPAGELQAPGGRYRALVVPPTRHLPLATLRRLEDLIVAGGAVKFLAVPADVPGLARLEERRRELTERLGRATLQPAMTPEDLVAWLVNHGVVPEPMAQAGLEFARRREPPPAQTTGYFITNLTATPFAGWLPLGRAHDSIVLQDPLNGRTWTPATQTGPTGRVPWVRLDPGQSVLITTAPRPPATHPTPAEPPTVAGGALPLPGPWELEFITGGPEIPAALVLPALVDWTTLADPTAARFAGTARYRTTFELPRNAPRHLVDWELDLGDVRESARIRLNGQEVGVSWSLPHRLRIGGLLRPGKNHLEIEVTNLAANRIRDLDRRGVNWRIMHEINFVDIRYQPFDASAWPLTPAGLLGPVRLVPRLRSPDY